MSAWTRSGYLKRIQSVIRVSDVTFVQPTSTWKVDRGMADRARYLASFSDQLVPFASVCRSRRGTLGHETVWIRKPCSIAHQEGEMNSDHWTGGMRCLPSTAIDEVVEPCKQEEWEMICQ